MRKLFSLIMLLAIFKLPVLGQVCGFDKMHEHQKKNPEILKQFTRNDEQLYHLISSGAIQPTVGLNGDPLYTIPIVIHVIHTGEPIGSIYNPTDDQLIKMVDYTNKVFDGTAPGMTGGVGDMQVQFVLAKRDPNCNPTNGIVRVNGSSLPGYTQNGMNLDGTSGASELSVKNLSRWNTTNYYNIWIVNKFDGEDGYSGGVVTGGFAYFPGVSASLDGTTMLASFSFEGDKVLPHELGHAFSLYHTFEGSNGPNACPANSNCLTQGDRVCDTDPVTNNGDNQTCRTGFNQCTGTPFSPNTESNIMAYTSCFTLFTAGQKNRVFAAMSLPSRLPLTTSLGATPPNQGSTICPPKINFAAATGVAAEANEALMDCRRYKDYNFALTIASPPSTTATAEILVQGGTALAGTDYIISTNGNFVSPSNLVSFPDGSAANRTFTIRVFDDFYIESAETIVLGFNVNANGGNALKGEGITTMTISITDNDVEPQPVFQVVDVVGTLTFQLGSAADGSQPLNNKLAKKKNTWVIRAGELTARGFSAGSVTAIAINVIKNGGRGFSNFQVKMGHTTRNYLVDANGAYGVSVATVRSQALFNTVAGWNIIPLDVPFAWDGTRNIAIEMCYDNGTAEPETGSDVTFGFADGGSSAQGSLYWNNTINCTENYSSINYYPNGVKPTTGFVMNIPGSLTENQLDATRNAYLGPFGEMYFYSAGGHILGKIKNLTAWDYGCTQVKIDRAGTGTKAFINSDPANAITDKTLAITTANDNPAGSFEITLFYRKNEVDGFKAATGTLWEQAGIARTQGAISSYTPGSVPLDATSMGMAPVRGFYSEDSTVRAGFTGLLSGGFGVVTSSTVLPVTWLSFSGRMEQGNALLEWSTLSEKENSHFVVEFSRNAQQFEAIGNVAATNQATAISSYDFTHLKPPGGINYYRIRQVDKDGRSALSNIIGLRSQPLESQPRVYPNPATTSLMLDWGNLAGKPGRWELLSTDMKLLKQGNANLTSAAQSIQIGHLPAGIYYIRITAEKEVRTLRFVKQ